MPALEAEVANLEKQLADLHQLHMPSSALKQQLFKDQQVCSRCLLMLKMLNYNSLIFYAGNADETLMMEWVLYYHISININFVFWSLTTICIKNALEQLL